MSTSETTKSSDPPKVAMDTSVKTAAPEKNRGVAFLSSYALIAFLLFLVFDFGFRILDHSAKITDPLESPNRSLIWWTVNGFAKESKAPDVVLLGSSLMMTAHHAGDATKTKQVQNEVKHFRSTCVQDFLSEDLHKNISCFSFAIAGQMASDAYVIARTMLCGEKRPKVIIYGIAPRDLIDNTLPSAASTETFKLLSRSNDLSDLALTARSTPMEILEYGLSSAFYTISHRANVVALQHRIAYNLAPYGSDAIEKNDLKSTFQLRLLAMGEFPEDKGANELLIAPYGLCKEPYRDNSEEYRQRYARIKQKTYTNQLLFLSKLMQLCKANGIELVIVNMPLTPGNVSLMPGGFYSTYKEKITSLAKENSAVYLDLNQPDKFEQKCFADTVHLNGLGGITFFKLLCADLAQNDSFRAALAVGK